MLKVDQCLPRGDRQANTPKFWLIWFCHILLPFQSNTGELQNPPMLKMEFLVWYRQTETSPSAEQSPSTTLRFSASSLSSVWLSFFSLLLSRKIPQFVLSVTKNRGFLVKGSALGNPPMHLKANNVVLPSGLSPLHQLLGETVPQAEKEEI